METNDLRKIEEEHLNWERTDFGGELVDLTLKLRLSSKETKTLIVNSLYGIEGVHVLFSKVACKSIQYSENDLRRDFVKTDFDSRYCLEAFLSQHGHMLRGKLSKQLAQHLNRFDSPADLCELLMKLSSGQANKRYLCLGDVVESAVAEFEPSHSKARQLMTNQDNGEETNVCLIRRATVTPTRVVFHFPEVNISNRVTRRFGVDNFLRVSLRDENSLKLNVSTPGVYDMTRIWERMGRLLKDGVILCGMMCL